MTLATLPTLAGQGIAVHKQPRWNTDAPDHATGRGGRARRYRWPLWDFELTFEGLDAHASAYYGSLGALTMQELASFFNQQQGQYQPFIYVDPTDNAVTGQAIATGDGATTSFQFMRSIGPFTGPVDVVTSVAAIYLDGVSTSAWTAANGYPYPEVTFTSAPAEGVAITADFAYAYLVRFSDDVQDVEEFMSRLAQVKSLKFQSVRIRDDATVYPVIGTSAGYTFYIFDDSCHLVSSYDNAATWIETQTSDETLSDDWTDMVMAINDGDYVTMAVIDKFTSPGQGPPFVVTAGDRISGIEITAAPTMASDPVLAPEIDPNTYYLDFVTGAISGSATVMIVAPFAYVGTGANVPRISRDRGATWSDITNGSPPNWAGATWAGFCMSAGAAIMYGVTISPGLPNDSDFGWKSVDGGTTWTQLTSGPENPHSYGDQENSVRLRCSMNGSVVIYTDTSGDYWCSHDGGGTWINFNVASLSAGFGSCSGADFGMTPDGSAVFVGGYDYANTLSHAWLSHDGGITFSEVTLPSASTYAFADCNISPDGKAMIVAYYGNHVDMVHCATDVSVDGGATFFQSLIPYASGYDGAPVSAIVVPGRAVPPADFFAPGGFATGGFSSADGPANTGSVTLVAFAGVVIVAVHTESTTPSAAPLVTSITSSGMTFVKRASAQYPNSPGFGSFVCNANYEIWWSYTSANLEPVTITVNLDSDADNCTIIASTIVGAHPTAPFDTNSSLPATATGDGTTPTNPTVTGVSTTATNGLLLLFGATAETDPHFGTTGGFVDIVNAEFSDGDNWSEQDAQYKPFSSAVSGATLTMGGTWNCAFIAIADAIVPA